MTEPSGVAGPPDEEAEAHLAEAAAWIVEYLRGVSDLPVMPGVTEGFLREELPARAPEDGEPLERVLDDFRRLIVPGVTHWNHPRFFGYFPTSASTPGIVGEMLTAALNVNAMVWRSAPAATELEQITTDWLRTMVGLPDGFEGVINDTASSSTLYALAAARESVFPEARERGLSGLPPGRIYASREAHSSVEKAVLTLGLGTTGYVAVDADRDFRMSPKALREALLADIADGSRPVAVVATLGTTSSTSIDPVSEIADIAEEHGLWLHVDAAYGGPAAILPQVRALFSGWERADSVVINPHKWLFTPMDCSVLYCRRPELLRRAFSIVPEYLTAPDHGEAKNLMDYGVSLGRRFRALKLWFVLRTFGRKGLAEALARHIDLARTLAGWIAEADSWELMAPTPLATVAFRYIGSAAEEELDRVNRQILDGVNRSGEAFLTHTELGGRVAIRVAIGNLETKEADVERVWGLLQREAAALSR